MQSNSKKVSIRDRHNNRREVSADDLIFRPAVYGVLLKENKVLLLPQWDGYDFPGGGIELGETIEEALEREVKEETGLTTRKNMLLHVQDDFFESLARDENYHSIQVYYLCRDFNGELSDAGFEEYEKEYMKLAQWIDISEIDKLKFYNSVDSVALVRQAAKMLDI